MISSLFLPESSARDTRLFLVLLVFLSTAYGLHAQARPAITGISHMCVYTADLAASDNFYGHILGATKGPDPLVTSAARYYFSPTQSVEVLPLPAEHTLSRLNCVAFATADARALYAYMEARHVEGVSAVETAKDGSLWFKAHDPEGNLVEFVQTGYRHVIPVEARPIGTRIIHVGYMVRNKAAEDKFYVDLLGFRPYWHGAMKPDYTDWISLQVPDGKDWIEYMMAGDGSTTPLDHLDARELGVMNHFSIGVPNMEKAVTTLYAEGRLSPRHDGPQMGLDGKWQANWYDPDGTRVELMEFQPVMKPCCSEFTAASPTE